MNTHSKSKGRQSLGRQSKRRKSKEVRASGPSQRQLRVGEELRHALANILGRSSLDDPALADISFTVTEVRLSPDLKVATAYVVPLGVDLEDGDKMADSVAALNRATGYFRGQLARTVVMRHCPRIVFTADGSFDYAGRVQTILERPHVRQDLKRASSDDESSGDGT